MKVIAHRGASGEYPENTLVAFEQAIAQGCDGIELDIQLYYPKGCSTQKGSSSSSELLVLHDASLTLEANGQLQALSDISPTQLAHYNQSAQQPVPTLIEALQAINGRTLTNIEIKLPETKQAIDRNFRQLLCLKLIEALSQVVTQGTCQIDDLLVSSFDHQILLELHRLAKANNLKELAMAALIEQADIELTPLAELNLIAVNPALNCLTADLVARIKHHKLKVWVFTVNQLEQIDYCQQLGVDAIFTDYPARAKQHLEKYPDQRNC